MGILLFNGDTLEMKMLKDFEREHGECLKVLGGKCSDLERVRASGRLRVIEASVKGLKEILSKPGTPLIPGGYSIDELERFDEQGEKMLYGNNKRVK